MAESSVPSEILCTAPQGWCTRGVPPCYSTHFLRTLDTSHFSIYCGTNFLCCALSVPIFIACLPAKSPCHGGSYSFPLVPAKHQAVLLRWRLEAFFHPYEVLQNACLPAKTPCHGGPYSSPLVPAKTPSGTTDRVEVRGGGGKFADM